MSVVKFRKFNVLMQNILPYIKFCPVTYREYPEVFSHVFTSIKDIPQFRSLIFGIPLSKFISVRKEPFFCSGFFFIASASTDSDINFKFLNGIKQSD